MKYHMMKPGLYVNLERVTYFYYVNMVGTTQYKVMMRGTGVELKEIDLTATQLSSLLTAIGAGTTVVQGKGDKSE